MILNVGDAVSIQISPEDSGNAIVNALSISTGNAAPDPVKEEPDNATDAGGTEPTTPTEGNSKKKDGRHHSCLPSFFVLKRNKKCPNKLHIHSMIFRECNLFLGTHQRSVFPRFAPSAMDDSPAR